MARKEPTTEQRRKGLEHAVTIAAQHGDLRYPGDFALSYGEKFADFLANGPAEPAVSAAADSSK
jgi:hypothetical protein